MAMDFDDILSDDNNPLGDDAGFSPDEIDDLGVGSSADVSIDDSSFPMPEQMQGDLSISSGGGLGGDDDSSSGHAPTRNLNMLLDVEVPVSIRMGTSKLFLKDVLGLSPGNIIELDEYADDLIQLTIGDKAIARGEVVIVDGYFAFRIKAIMSKTDRIQQLKG